MAAFIFSEEELIGLLVTDILAATRQWETEHIERDELPTAAELARKHKLRLEKVKKKLRLLKEVRLIEAVTINPKRYRFDWYALHALDEDHLLYPLFCDPESPYFIEPT